jgi:WD40 repeat protein
VAETGKHLRTFSAHRGAVFDADWKGDRTIATAGADCTVRLFGIDGAFQLLNGHTERAVAVAWNSMKTVSRPQATTRHSAYGGPVQTWYCCAGTTRACPA